VLKFLSRLSWPPPARRCQSQKDKDGTVQAQNGLVVQASDARADLCFRHGRDLVHHEAAGAPQSIAIVRLDAQAEQGCLGRIGGEGADGDGLRGVEAIVLNNNNRPRLAGVILAAGDRVNVAALNSSPRAASESMKA